MTDSATFGNSRLLNSRLRNNLPDTDFIMTSYVSRPSKGEVVHADFLTIISNVTCYCNQSS